MYVYIKSEGEEVYVVGFYVGFRWEPESDHDSKVDAGKRVHFLNGGSGQDLAAQTDRLVAAIRDVGAL